MQSRALENKSENRPVWLMLAWAGVALQVIALIFALWPQRWGGAWTIGGFAMLSTASW